MECQEEEVGLDMAGMVAGEEESVGVEVGALASEGALPHGLMLGEGEEAFPDGPTTPV